MSVKTISAGTFSPDISTRVLFCDTSKGQINIELPNIQASQLNDNDYELYIIDTTDNASNNNIILIANSTNTNQQVNSKSRIVLAQDGAVASLTPASLFDWVCNVSSLEAQQQVGFSQIPKTNLIKYKTDNFVLRSLAGTPISLPIASRIIKGEKGEEREVFQGISFVANIGKGNKYFLYETRIKKLPPKEAINLKEAVAVEEEAFVGEEPVESSKWLLFKRITDTTMNLVDVISQPTNLQFYGWDYINNFDSDDSVFYSTLVTQQRELDEPINKEAEEEEESKYDWIAYSLQLRVFNDKLVYRETETEFNALDVWNKYSNFPLTETDNPNFEIFYPDYAGMNDSNAMLENGKYENWYYLRLNPKGFEVIVPDEVLVNNIVGFNFNNPKEGILVELLNGLNNAPNFSWNDKLTEEDKALICKKASVLVMPIGIAFSCVDGKDLPETITEENENDGITGIYCQQSSKSVLYLKDTSNNALQYGQPKFTKIELFAREGNTVITFGNNSVYVVYPAYANDGGFVQIQEGLNLVGSVNNLSTMENLPLNIAIKGISSDEVSAINFLIVNNGILIEVQKTDSKNRFKYNNGTEDATFIDSSANIKPVASSTVGVIQYTSFENNTAISTRQSGNSISGVQILEDVFQNINNFID